MEAFSQLLERLYYTSSTLAKTKIMIEYLRNTPDPDRGWAIAAVAGELRFELFKRNLIKQMMMERVDPYLFELSYDYVGELSETVAHLWTPDDHATRLNRLPELSEVIEQFQMRDKPGIREHLHMLMDNMTPQQRWALLKLGTRGLRIGISARFMKKILAEYGNVPVDEIEILWHGLTPPYTDLLNWLDGTGDKPDISESVTFHPVMLSHPLESQDLERLTPSDWQAEWKYDGIRVQLVVTAHGKALFSRTGDDISHSFPDVMQLVDAHCILDGELLVIRNEEIGSFNELQQRLGKKKPTKKLMSQYPAGLIVYDALSLDGDRVTAHPLARRREMLAEWLTPCAHDRLRLSPTLDFTTTKDLIAYREETQTSLATQLIEGLMLKRKDSAYVPGRPKGQWFKWKRDPMMVDAVMMYAQRGHGKRSSLYSDYTFGLWDEGNITPIGKAYSGFTDKELKELHTWVRRHTIQKFGPVLEVEKELVLEIAFDSVHQSSRHKSGVALRFPRIHRIRWDKPAAEADALDVLKQMVS